MKLSRQFRNKDNEYFEFDLTTNSSPQNVQLALRINGLFMKLTSDHRIDWGDGSNPQSIDDISLTHTYSTAGTYPVKIWTREKDKNISAVDFGLSGYDIGTLDFSDFKYLNRFDFGINTSIGNLSMPTQYLGIFSLDFNSLGVNINFTNTILDLSVFSGISKIYLFGGTNNVNRIKLPPSNASGFGQFYWTGELEAVGPNADNLSNFEADFTDFNLSDQFQFNGTSTAPTSVSLPSSAFYVTGIGSRFNFINTGITSIDLTYLKSAFVSGISFGLYNNRNLTTITWPTSFGPGTFNRFSAYDCPSYAGVWDFSWANIQNSIAINLTDTLATGIILSASSATISYIYAHPNASVSTLNAQCTSINLTSVPNATEVNNFSLRMQNNNMTASEVNKILVDLDTNSTGSFTGRDIDLSGNNAAPDTTSGGLDGSTAKTNLLGKGFTVTTN